MSLEELLDRLRALPPLAVDTGIAVVCYGATVAAAFDKDHASGPAFLLAALASLPLVWRRRYPIPVTVLTGAGTVGLALIEALGHLPFSQVVATYTFASLCTPLGRLVGVLGTAAGITVSMLVPQEPVTVVGIVVAIFAAAYALGTSARARRDRIALLEERTRRLAESHAAAAAQERERIARDMHDILAHSISLIVVQAEAGPVVVRTKPDRAEAAFDTIARTGRDALAQLRRTLGILRGGQSGGEDSRQPQPDLGGIAALAEQGRRAGLEVSLEEHGQARPLPAEVAVTAYRMVQESLTNTLKHAAASRFWIRLYWDTDQLRVDVWDNGRGPRGETDNGGHGLVGMRERVAACGGQLAIGQGSDGAGFHVTATLPARERHA